MTSLKTSSPSFQTLIKQIAKQSIDRVGIIQTCEMLPVDPHIHIQVGTSVCRFQGFAILYGPEPNAVDLVVVNLGLGQRLLHKNKKRR